MIKLLNINIYYKLALQCIFDKYYFYFFSVWRNTHNRSTFLNSSSLRHTRVMHFYNTININQYTGGPRYMREIGTQKIGSHITNSHIKRPRVTVNQRIGSRKEAISGSNILEIADKKTAYNEGCLYLYRGCNPHSLKFHVNMMSIDDNVFYFTLV
jgi:hypothetical protein